MTRFEYKRNTRLLGLFWSFSGINVLVTGALAGGVGPLIGLGTILLAAAFMIVFDRRESNKDSVAVWCAGFAHLFLTGFVSLVSFHWIIVVLYFLELALCVYIWRKK